MRTELKMDENENTMEVIIDDVPLCTIHNPNLELITNIYEIRKQFMANGFEQWVDPAKSNIELKITGTVSRFTQIMFEEEMVASGEGEDD